MKKDKIVIPAKVLPHLRPGQRSSMSFNIFEPWRDAEAHAARLEEEYRKYGTGNCESCGKTVWHDEHFCSECMEIAIDDVRYFTDWLAEKKRLAARDRAGNSIQRPEPRKAAGHCMVV